MAKSLNKAYKKLDIRQKAWEVTIKTLPNGSNISAFRKPGSMKRNKG